MLYQYTCKHCGKPFVHDRRGKQFCSSSCYQASRHLTPANFWARVDRSRGPDACWTWKMARSPKGYGQVWNGRYMDHAMRVAWELTYGLIPDGMSVCHTCDNPPCCNPSHLFLGTNADNVADRCAKGRTARGEQIARAKLTREQVDEIRAQYAQGVTRLALARRYGIDTQHVTKIVTYQLWARQ